MPIITDNYLAIAATTGHTITGKLIHPAAPSTILATVTLSDAAVTGLFRATMPNGIASGLLDIIFYDETTIIATATKYWDGSSFQNEVDVNYIDGSYMGGLFAQFVNNYGNGYPMGVPRYLFGNVVSAPTATTVIVTLSESITPVEISSGFSIYLFDNEGEAQYKNITNVLDTNDGNCTITVDTVFDNTPTNTWLAAFVFSSGGSNDTTELNAIKAKTDLITDGTVITVQSTNPIAGVIAITVGNSYKAADGRAITTSISLAVTFTGGTTVALLVTNNANGAITTISGTYTTTSTYNLSFDITATITNTLSPSATYSYEMVATLANGDKVSVEVGAVDVTA